MESMWARSTRGIVAVCTTLIITALVACERPTQEIAGPSADIMETEDVVLRFRILDSDQGDAAVAGAALWLYGLENDETVLIGIFNDNATGDLDGDVGEIKIKVPEGSYGAMIKAIPVPTQTLEYVAPVPALVGLVEVPHPFVPIVILDGEDEWACATGDNVAQTLTLPIDAVPPEYDDVIKFDVDTRSCDFTEVDIAFPGSSPGDPVYGVIGADGQTLLGIGDNDPVPGLQRGVLGFVSLVSLASAPSLSSLVSTASVPAGSPFATILCPVDANFTVELYQTVQVAGKSVNRVASLELGNSCDEVPASATLTVETSRCAIETDTATDSKFGMAEWGYGFLRGDVANGESPKILDLTTASALVTVRANGKYSVTFTTDKLVGGTLKSTADFTCTNGSCVVNGVKHTGGGNPQGLALFFAPDPANAGHVLVEAVLTGIPAHDKLLWSAKGPNGANLPRPPNKNATSSSYLFRKVPNNGTCIGDSNDGTWSVKGL